ncbi:MAG: ABC transporter ATP-binding protein [Gemmatimonadaceae bacterium]|nr:ABC transporter ATP-binding protein [Gemmatimonadaceae bacterium]MDQ3518484.1 ABC transporter ATP-binding protein [Gemmatimonadota bacterium]
MEVAAKGLQFEREGRLVLDIPALTFASGTTTAIFGPNGSGKTTLLRLVATLEMPTRGHVRFGNDVASSLTFSRQSVAYAFQQPVFLRGTVYANLELGLRLRGVARGEREARISDAARECGITHILQRSARNLSGGEAQRANVARALALRAPVTLLDEPLAGLDRVARAQLLDDLPRLLATFATTTILVTHDREEAFRIAEHLVILVAGVVRASGAKSEIYRQPPDRETAELLGYMVAPVNGRLVAIPPGGLRAGTGADAFQVVVDRVVDMGNHQHVLGTVGGARVDVRLPAHTAAPSQGSLLSVVAQSEVLLP